MVAGRPGSTGSNSPNLARLPAGPEGTITLTTPSRTDTTTTTDPPPSQVIELDSRGRTTIRIGDHDRYRATRLADGTLILEPVFVLTQDELILRSHPDLERRIEDAMRDPTQWVRRPRPTVKD
jgi:hypothetical protein